MKSSNGEKVCSSCKRLKPATREYFYASASQHDRLQARCIECDKERARNTPPRLSAGNVGNDASAIFARSVEHARRVAAHVHRATPPDRYRGVSGGPLLAGYVR